MIYNEEEVTIVAARNSTSAGETWSNKDVETLEGLAMVLEIVSADDLKIHPLPAVQQSLVAYYDKRIRYHAERAMFVGKGKAEFVLFEDANDGLLSGRLPLYSFVQCVDDLSHSVDFYAGLKATLTLNELRRVTYEMKCPGFRRVKVVLLKSLPSRKVKAWPLPKSEFPATPRLEAKFVSEVKKRKNIHAEMVLVAHLIGGYSGPRSDVFPYLGVSKKTCLLCGHLLLEMGGFETRGNHGKCYSQWTLPSTLWTSPETAERLRTAVERLRDILRDEGTKPDALPRRDAEKESMVVAPVPPRYETTSTIFNRVVNDPRFLAKDAEWWTVSRGRDGKVRESRGATDAEAVPSSDDRPIAVAVPYAQGGAIFSDTDVGGAKGKKARACAFCKATGKLILCKKCGAAAYCDSDCCRSDRYRHKFSCRLGRPIDATDYLVFSCRENEFPRDDDVERQYGFLYFGSSGRDQWRLFQLYRRLVVNWGIDEDELRSAVEHNKLTEMLTERCSQSRDPVMLRDILWLKSQEGFGANAEGRSFSDVLEATRRELLTPDEMDVPMEDLKPPEKNQALLFYAGIRPDTSEDNWISLGFCTATDCEADQRLARAYRSLVDRCPFDEFWKAMAQSRMVDLFSQYGLADQISHMRNFEDMMSTVHKYHYSVWDLKQFTRTAMAHPIAAVAIDYGFRNCETSLQRMQLREIYKEYFERGEDEAQLHGACIAGRLKSFLKEALGGHAIPAHILQNPYPKKDFSFIGMAADSAILCPESISDEVAALKLADEEEVTILTIPDADDRAMVNYIRDRPAFLGTGLRKRYYSGSNGQVIKELSL